MGKDPTLVALVEDDPSVRTALRRVLSLSGYEVLAFAGGMEFLGALSSTRLDCVLMDVHMPQLCGFEVAKRIRALGYDVPIVFMTAACDGTMPSKVDAAGAACLLHKPFAIETLIAALEGLLVR